MILMENMIMQNETILRIANKAQNYIFSNELRI